MIEGERPAWVWIILSNSLAAQVERRAKKVSHICK